MMRNKNSCDLPSYGFPNCYFIISFISLCLLNSDVTQLKKELDDLVDAIVKDFFEPEKNKLQPKPE